MTHKHHIEARLSINAALGYDPTRTTSLRARFVREMNKRFRRLRGLIRDAIVDKDCFGLKPDTGYSTNITANADSGLRPRQFNFPRSDEKVDAFMEWLREKENKEILEVTRRGQVGRAIDERWTDTYVRHSYQRGVERARNEMRRANFDVPSVDESGGIERLLNQPIHADRLGLLYSRTFNELKGITESMDQHISRALTEEMARGAGPLEIARTLNKTISGPIGDLAIKDSLGRFIPAERRAQTLARTEVIRAHHQATIQSYRNFGAAGVQVRAEWSTAGDSRVCAKCQDLAWSGDLGGGRYYSLDTIESLIPAHPNCRCVALPIQRDKIEQAEAQAGEKSVFTDLPQDERATLRQIGSSLRMSDDDLEELGQFWKQHSRDMDELFDQGTETCTFSTGRLGHFLESKGYNNVEYVTGDFKDAGHWWNQVRVRNERGKFESYLLDFGDNISEEAIRTGHIKPKIIKSKLKREYGYVMEEMMDRKQFLDEMASQGYARRLFRYDQAAAREAAEEVAESIPAERIDEQYLPNNIRTSFADETKKEGIERSVVLDRRGRQLTDVVVGDEETVGGFYSGMEKAGSRLITVHSHPVKKSFSMGDIRSLAQYEGVERMVVVMPDRTAQMMVQKGSRRDIIATIDDMFTKKRKELIDQLDDGVITKTQMKSELDKYRNVILKELDTKDHIDLIDETGLVYRKGAREATEEVVEEVPGRQNFIDPEIQEKYINYFSEYYSEIKDRSFDEIKDYVESVPSLRRGKKLVSEWQGGTLSRDPLRWKVIAENHEKTTKNVYLGHQDTETIRQVLEDVGAIDDYLQFRAFNQAYMRSRGVEKITLYRGASGNSGKELRKVLRNSPSKVRLNEAPLTSYTEDYDIADTFSRGALYRQEVPADDIVVHKDLLSGITGEQYRQKEFIVLGKNRDVDFKDFEFEWGREGDHELKRIGE